MYTWADVVARQYHQADIERDMQRIHLADQATREPTQSIPDRSRYLALISVASALLARILPHVARS